MVQHRRAALPIAVADQINLRPGQRPSDWTGSSLSFSLAWCLPVVAMVLSTSLNSVARATIWTAMLLWMGGACLLNARRCHRTHCLFTGPFFILMSVGVVAYASGVLRLGPNGWGIIGGIALVGALSLCWVSERIFGKFMPWSSLPNSNGR